jgi:hypothetical protein
VTEAAATIPGSLAARQQQRKEQRKVKPPPRSDYPRGATRDRLGNRR